MSQGDFLKASGNPAAVAAAAAEAANLATAKGAQNYAKEYEAFASTITPDMQAFLPDPARVKKVAGSDPSAPIHGSPSEPMKVPVNVPSPAVSGESSQLSAHAGEFTPGGKHKPSSAPSTNVSASTTAAPGMPPSGQPENAFMAPQNYSMGMPGMMPGMMPSMPPGMPNMPYPPYMTMNWPPAFDPMQVQVAMGKGGMTNFPPMMPTMFPPMAGMPGMPPVMPMPSGSPNAASGAGGDKNNTQGKSEKTRERRRRKNKSNRAEAEQPDNDEAAATRSEELNMVKKNAGVKLTLQQFAPHITEFAKDQHGSRWLQCKIDEPDPEATSEILEAVLKEAEAMSKDQFGNFVVQKLFDVGNQEQKMKLANALRSQKDSVYRLSKEQHGCRVIQKALQQLPRDMQASLTSELNDKVKDCILDMNGNHVIQKCIEQMPPDSVSFIIDAITKEVYEMASHMYGCRVIQRLLEHCASHQLKDMLEKLLNHGKDLSKNLYGNYVVQHMLEHGRVEDKKKIIEVIRENIMEFAKEKCSSNVVEKCFEIATIGEHATQLEEDRQNLFKPLMSGPAPGAPINTLTGRPMTPLQELTINKFGNYIVQRMLDSMKGADGQQLRRELVNPDTVELLKTNQHGKHILHALRKEQLIPEETEPTG